MKLIKNVVLSVMLCLIQTSVFAKDNPDTKSINDTFIYEGAINQDAYEKIRSYVEAGGRHISITSPGGDAKYGQKIAMLIIDKDVTVTVMNHCFSACANYVFLSAKNKILSPDALLGFHGWIGETHNSKKNARKKHKNPQVESMLRAFQLLIKTDVTLYKKIGFNTELFSVGMNKIITGNQIWTIDFEDEQGKSSKQFSSSVEMEAFLKERSKNSNKFSFSMKSTHEGLDTGVYFPSQSTLESYGVKGILAYDYPKTAQELEVRAKKVSEDLRVVNDL